jgi:hypothetical protein
MCTTQGLVMLYFTKNFILECDALGRGRGMVLTQEGNPSAFISKKLCDCNLEKLAYDKEMMTILHVVEAQHPYLIGRHFQIKIYRHSLKYFLEQRLSSPEKHQWVTKMFGHDYEII